MGKGFFTTRKILVFGILSTTTLLLVFSNQVVGAQTNGLGQNALSALMPPSRPVVDNSGDTYDFGLNLPTNLVNGGAWQQVGSGAVLVPNQVGSHAESGRVSSIAVSTGQSNVTIYLGSAQGGVWSSNNGGTTWRPLTDNQATLSTGSVAVDPNNPSVIYVGTGEQNFSADSRYGKGILKSTNGGVSWALLGSNVFGGQHIGRIVVDSHNSASIWVAADRGIYHSPDGGQTWTLSLGFRFGPGNRSLSGMDVHIDSTNSNVLYANFSYYGIYKSTNGGATWNWISRALPGWMAGFHSASMAVEEGASDATDTIYASAVSVQGELMGMYVSHDGGDTWSTIRNVPQYFDLNFSYNGQYDATNAAGQGPYDNTIAVDPTNPQHILAGGVTLIESRDGGQSWTVLDTFLDHSHTPIADLAPNQHTIVFDDKGNAFVGNDGGIYEETKDGTWLDLNSSSLDTIMFNSGMSATGEGQQILGGTQGTGTVSFTKSSGSWNQIFGNDGGYTYIDARRTNSMFAESPFGNIVHTTDSGSSWLPWKPGYVDNSGLNAVAYTAPFTVRPIQNGTYEVLVGSECITRMSTDGSTYTAISHDFTMGPFPDEVVTLIQSKVNPNVVYAGTTYGQVYACFNAEGADPQWTMITPFPNDPTNAPDARATVSAIAINPLNDKEITVTYGNPGSGSNMPMANENNHVYWCSNTAAQSPSWVNVTSNLPFSYVDSATYLGPIVLVGTDQGVYAGIAGKAKWVKIGTGLPNVAVTNIVPVGGLNVVIGTYGRGSFSLDLTRNLGDLLQLLH